MRWKQHRPSKRGRDAARIQRLNYLIHCLYTHARTHAHTHRPNYNNRIKCEIAPAKSLSRIHHPLYPIYRLSEPTQSVERTVLVRNTSRLCCQVARLFVRGSKSKFQLSARGIAIVFAIRTYGIKPETRLIFFLFPFFFSLLARMVSIRGQSVFRWTLRS